MKRSVLDWLEANALKQRSKRTTCTLHTKAFDRLCDELGASRNQDSVLVSFDKGVVVQRRVFVVREATDALSPERRALRV
jgi:hypothetical protein